MSKLIAVVTGANKGIGYYAALALASKYSVKVYMGARDKSRGEAAANKLKAQNLDVEYLALDVTSAESIANAVTYISQEHGKLDILINNAGIFASPESRANAAYSATKETVDGYLHVYETNLFGPINVTKAFLPLLEAGSQKSIVMVSSGLGSITLANSVAHKHYGIPCAAYSTSKAALNMFAVQLSVALQGRGFKVNSADPGYTKTDFNGNRGENDPVTTGAFIAQKALSSESGIFFAQNSLMPW